MISTTKEFFRETSQRMIKWADSRASALRDWVQQPWDVARFSQSLLGAAVLSVIIWLWRQKGRKWLFAIRRSTGRTNHDPIRREASRWLQRGQRRSGFDWPSEVELALLRLRFGAPDSWSDPLDVFRSAKLALKSKR